MAKHNSRKRRDNMESVKIIALVVFILIGLGVIAGSIWYYLSFKPRAAADISAVAKSFTLDYFNVSYEDITGTEGKPWMTEAFAQRAASGQRVAAWQESELVSRVKGDVEITIHRQGLRAATVQATFWQYEETKDEEGKEYLVYYDYDLVRVDGVWLIDNLRTPTSQGLEELRRRRGVYDQHYNPPAGNENEEDEDGEEPEEEEE